MSNWLNRFSPALLKLVKTIGKEAQIRGLKAYVVGGIVRDLILEKKNLDLDVVVEGDAFFLARLLAAKYKAVVVVHEKFGTATLTFPNQMRVDIATARKEQYPYPGALPVVEQGTIRDDLSRRDFTINAMAICLNPDDFGKFVDYFDGYKDLRSKRIRVLHAESFMDDPTRILRAVRFEQRLGFKLEEETRLLLQSALKKKAETSVKPERYFQEFRKNLREIQVWKNIKRLHQLGALKFLGKGTQYNRSTENLMRSLQSQITWHEQEFEEQRLQAGLVQCMALLYGVPQGQRLRVVRAFHLSNYEKDNILVLGKIKGIMKKLSGASRLSEVARILKPLKRETILFIRALANRAVRLNIDAYWIKGENLRLSLDGHDLRRLGIKEGLAVGQALKKLWEKKMDGEIVSRRDELKLARTMVPLK